MRLDGITVASVGWVMCNIIMSFVRLVGGQLMTAGVGQIDSGLQSDSEGGKTWSVLGSFYGNEKC